MLFTRKRSASEEDENEEEVLQAIRELSQKHDINIFYGPPDAKFAELVDFSDCNFKKNKYDVCGFLYQDFETLTRRKRFKFTFEKFDIDQIEKSLDDHFKQK